MSASDKLHRWLDLLASLLSRRYPVSIAELRRDVPAYADDSVQEESVLRTFERDKGELRELGVVIDTVPDENGVGRYQLRRKDFYLPLLSVCQALLPDETEIREQPRRTRTGGTGGLPALVLTPDECHVLRRAAARVAALGHPELADDATRALRKLQFDLEDFVAELPAATVLRVDGDVFDVLTEAVALRKRLTFTYHSMERNETAERLVEPYGLVFLTGHWYLVAFDPRAAGMRQFRVSRIREARMASRPQHPDFEVPATFELSAYAASRRSWELGNGEQERIYVVFRGDTGQVAQGGQLGEDVVAVPDDVLSGMTPADSMVRVFSVRRREPFLRWLLSFAGDARPVAPGEVVSAWRTLLTATRTAQHDAAAHVTASEVA
jgi:predicted DNA-binding transcriptional regulator YafY